MNVNIINVVAEPHGTNNDIAAQSNADTYSPTREAEVVYIQTIGRPAARTDYDISFDYVNSAGIMVHVNLNQMRLINFNVNNSVAQFANGNT